MAAAPKTDDFSNARRVSFRMAVKGFSES